MNICDLAAPCVRYKPAFQHLPACTPSTERSHQQYTARYNLLPAMIVVRARLAGVTCSPFRLQLRLTIQRPPAPAFLRIASARRRARSRSADLLASDAPRPCDGLSESRSRPSRRAAARARASLLAFAAALMRQPPAAVLSRTALLVRADGSSDRADLGRNDRVDSPDGCADEGRNDRPDSPD